MIDPAVPLGMSRQAPDVLALDPRQGAQQDLLVGLLHAVEQVGALVGVHFGDDRGHFGARNDVRQFELQLARQISENHRLAVYLHQPQKFPHLPGVQFGQGGRGVGRMLAIRGFPRRFGIGLPQVVGCGGRVFHLTTSRSTPIEAPHRVASLIRALAAAPRHSSLACMTGLEIRPAVRPPDRNWFLLIDDADRAAASVPGRYEPSPASIKPMLAAASESG
jgi:hypothetical protein